MRRFTEISLALILSIGAVASVAAQTAAGTLEVHVTDDSGAIIPGAEIAVVGAAGVAGTAPADAQGKHAFANLAPGAYKARVSWPGFAAAESGEVSVVDGQTALVNVALHIQVSEEKVTVEAEAPQALSTDPSSNAGALVLRGADLDALPDDPDDLAADLKALAGPSAGLGDVQMFIDGFSGGHLPSKESIREVRINQNPFSAEYDRVGFGRVEIFTKPGSDHFHGMGFWKLSDDMFNSRNPYAPIKPPYLNNQFGGNVGGPLGSRASVFLDVEHRSIDDNAVINATTVDSAFHIVPLRAALNAPDSYSNLSARVDYQLTQNNTLVSRFNWWDSSNQNAGIGGFSLASTAYRRSQTGYTLQMTETAVLSPAAINETHFQFSRTSMGQTGQNDSAALIVMDSFNGGGAQVPYARDAQNHFEIQNATSLSLGAHLVRFGARVRTVSLTDATTKYFDGQYLFAAGMGPELNAANQPVLDALGAPVMISLSSIERYRRTLLFSSLGMNAADIRTLGGGASQFYLTSGTPQSSLGLMDAGLYVQDDWRVRPNFSLSAGLRWEAQRHLRDWLDFAPRLSFAWAPGGGKHSKTVIRGGAGIFYDRIAENLLLDVQRFNGTTQQQYIVHDPNFYPAVPPMSQVAALGLSTVRSLQTGLRAPYMIQTAIGVERQLPLNLVLALNYINTRGLHLLSSRNINAPLPDGSTPFNGGNIYQYESNGTLRQNQLITSVSRRFSRGLSVFGYYAYGRAYSNTDGANTFPMNQYDLTGEYGRAATDIRHRAVIGASMVTPLGIRVSPFLLARSGAPFNIVTGTDSNGDSLYTDRPAFAANPAAAGTIATRWGAFNPTPGPGDVIIPRNYGQAPGYFTLNFRISRTFGFGGVKEGAKHAAAKHGGGAEASSESGLHNILRDGSTDQRYNLTLSMQVRNALNHTNPGMPVGSLGSPLFGQSIWLASSSGPDGIAGGDNRRAQIQLRLTF